jgi:hypothetical protein
MLPNDTYPNIRAYLPKACTYLPEGTLEEEGTLHVYEVSIPCSACSFDNEVTISVRRLAVLLPVDAALLLPKNKSKNRHLNRIAKSRAAAAKNDKNHYQPPTTNRPTTTANNSQQ